MKKVLIHLVSEDLTEAKQISEYIANNIAQQGIEYTDTVECTIWLFRAELISVRLSVITQILRLWQ
jgi:hypothetical protein